MLTCILRKQLKLLLKNLAAPRAKAITRFELEDLDKPDCYTLNLTYHTRWHLVIEISVIFVAGVTDKGVMAFLLEF